MQESLGHRVKTASFTLIASPSECSITIPRFNWHGDFLILTAVEGFASSDMTSSFQLIKSI